VPETEIVKTLTEEGPWGIVVLVLMYVIYMLIKFSKEQQVNFKESLSDVVDTNKDTVKHIVEEHEKRADLRDKMLTDAVNNMKR